MLDLANTYESLGKDDKAIALYEKILTARKSKLGTDHPETILSMNKLVVSYSKLGQLDKALAPNDEVLALREKKLIERLARLGSNDPDTLKSIDNLASTYESLGQHDKSLALHKKVFTPLQSK